MKRHVLSLCLVLAACGSRPVADACPNDLPAACPSPAPGWSDVQPVIAVRCARCHSPGGVEEKVLLDNYDHVFAQRRPALNQLFACKMPPAGEPAPTAEERALLLSWFVCGAPP